WTDFHPHPLCFHPHLMTVLPRHKWWRPSWLNDIPCEPRLFRVAPDSQILGHCHWQQNRQHARTLLLVHGFEGCSDSHYMLGIADKTWRTGLNVIRLNQRNCGGTEHLTPTLYHSGMSDDFAAVIRELAAKDGLHDIWAAGYSMGGNLILKMAGEVCGRVPSLQGLVAVSPNIDPAACVEALERPANWFYQHHFLTGMKARVRRKAAHFPNRFDLTLLSRVSTLREFDDRFTAPFGGFQDAADYYERVGARHVLGRIRVPTLILTAQDDPFIPFRTFMTPAVQANPSITLLAPEQGGHCGFFQRHRPDEDGYWAENRLVEWVVGGGPARMSLATRPPAGSP
ncbi:MAG: alpha/beta fold hydrolase, partial [Nitrospirota bacterium]|nr:alpha/beta fold hydrolase [Nitrospirota bacterium]